MRTDQRPAKLCATCGRRFTWRRRWRTTWESVRYCSRRCRERRPNRLDRQLEAAIRSLAATRPANATLCPSEAARRVRQERWRELMERTRSAALRLAAAGEIEVVQRGARVDPSTARGPIQLARARLRR